MKTKPACKVDTDGNKFWYLNGKIQREDGPAIELANGDKYWYLNGKAYEPSAHEIIIYKMKYENSISRR